ncbi:hypothetical protein SO802_017907 [Lithocarpus litseifolius]|uniref:Exo_endo_phos domain-containing protein n=1 Tax=Lithocarpus litseifolius TaxID=425828 RepID=A0AAW2CJC5_9ROSI
MEETTANQIWKPSTQVHISAVENSNGNPNIMEGETVEKLIPKSLGFKDGQTSIPFQIESPNTTQVTKIYTAREEIEENHDTNLVLVPITYEATNVELKCDPHVPETHPANLSHALSCEDDHSLANVRKWKRVVKKETNPLKIIMAEGDPITEVVGRKQRKNVEETNSFDIDVRKKTRGQKKDVSLDIQTYSLNHIDARIMTDLNSPWRLTGFYGRPEEHRKHESWSYLRHLHSRDSLPWLCIGDYNEILNSNEEQGRIPRPLRPMEEFRTTLAQCGLSDLGFQGNIFTWRNGRPGDDFVQ